MASFTNGDFETGDLAGWTVETYRNTGLLADPPTVRSQLNLSSGGVNYTKIISGVAEMVLPAGLPASATLKVPRYGSKAVVVNELGASNNVNGIKQSMVTGNADVDPNDGKVHVRFALAPVLQNPGHGTTEQPYFWATLTNVTKNTVLFHTFNYSNQAGVPWKTETYNYETVLYTDWQSFDISPGAAQLAVGDTVELEVIAAGCSQGGHYGHVYLDGIGANLPGLAVAASAPAAVNTGAQLTYTFTYSNHGAGAASNTTVTETLPAGTTFASVSGASCTAPSPGGTGTVTCNIGTVNPASSGSFTVTVNVTAASGSTISNGTYSISATGVSALIGPLVTTSVSTGTTYADLRATATDGVAAVAWGAGTTYTVTVQNDGPSAADGASITVPVPTHIASFNSWTCSGSGGATCATSSGTGAIASTASALPSGGQVTYTIDATVAPGSGGSTISLLATAATPSGVTDSDTTNNVAVDYNEVGTLRTLSLAKSGGGVGTVLSSPTAIACGASCSAVFLDGTTVVLTASTSAGSRFTGWTAGPCAGSGSPTCNVPLSADTAVTADFMEGDWMVTGSAPAGNGTVSCTSPLLTGASSTCTITADSGFALSALTDNGVSVFGSVSSGTYSITSVGADHAVVGTFAALPIGITVSSGTASYGYPGAAVVVDPGVVVVAGSNLDNAKVAIGSGFVSGQDELSFTASGGITGSYDAATGILTLSGNASAAAYQTVLRTVKYDNSGTGATSGTRTIAFSLGSGLNYAATGHFYEFVSTAATTWSSAKTAAEARRYFGLKGYLATITSSGENTFISTKVQSNGWIGAQASGGTFPRTWSWATGPEAASAICSNTSAGTCTSISGAYSNWASGEPNSAGSVETVGQIYSAGANWNDLSAAAVQLGYMVEYGGMAGDPVVVLAGSRGVSVVIAIPTTTAVASSASSAVWGQPVHFTATVSPSSATGTVQFKIDGTNLGSPVAVSGGVATSSSTGSLSVADHTIGAVYSGDATHITSSGSDSQTVVEAGTTVTLVSSAATTIYRSSVTLTATVAITSPGAGTPTGTVAFDVGGMPISGCTAQAVSGGTTATCVTSDLPVGIDTLHATYSGDAHFVGAGPHATVVEVTRATPSVAIASSANPSVFGSSVTFTATASGVGVTPTGAVVFSDGGTTLCSTTLSAGVATCTVALLSTPSHTITVAYAGDGNYLPVAPTLTQTVNKAPTSTALVAAPTPSTYGQVVTLTTTVTGPAVTPSGTIAFRDGVTPIAGCSTQAMTAGVATCVLPNTLIGGSHAFAATYSGDGSFLTSSGSASHTTNKANPTLALATSKPLSTYGEPVTFTVTASYAVGVPTGQVSVMDGATLVCGPVTLVTGTANCNSNLVAVGPRTLTATYVGDGNFTTATSPSLSQFQVRGTTTSDVVASLNQSVLGQAVTLTATVYPDAPSVTIPTGSITFRDSASVLCDSVPVDAEGVASCTTSSLSVGVHALSGRYNGSTGYSPSTSFSYAVKVNPAATQVALAASPTSSVFGQSVTFTFTVPTLAPGAGVATGTVTLSDSGVALPGCTDRPLSGATASCSTAALPVGTRALGVSYSGDGNFQASSASPSFTVAKAATTTTVATSLNPAIFGQGVTFTAAVVASSPGAGSPSGTVTFSDGVTILGTGTLSGGVATYATAGLSPTSHSITASYAGDGSFFASGSSALTEVVNKTSVTVSLAPSIASSTYGQAVTFSMSVSAVSPGTGTPTGTVVLSDGGTTIATLTLSGGSTTWTNSGLAVGTHQLTATYGGDSGFNGGAIGPSAFVVSKASPTLALATSKPLSAYGERLTFTVTASAPSGLPTGQVSVMDDATLICGPVTLVEGSASCESQTVSVGTRRLTASYGGDGNFLALSSPPLTQRVVRGTTTTDVVANMGESVYGQPVLLTATVHPDAPSVEMPTGAITFRDSAGVLCPDVAVDSSGVATCTTTALSVGVHALSGRYNGSTGYSPSTSFSYAVKVNKASTQVALAASPTSSSYGQTVTFTISVPAVSPGAGVATGTVNLTDGGTAVAGCTGLALSGATVSCTISTFLAGTHALGLSYGGDGNFLASTGSASYTVVKAETSTALASSLNPSVYGSAVTFTSTVAGTISTPTGTVTFSDGEVAICSSPVALATGVATCSPPTSSFGAGTHAIAVAYSGDDNYNSSSRLLSQVVSRAMATAAVVSAANPSVWGQPVTFTATLTGVTGGAVPGGSVQFQADAASFGSAVTLASGAATSAPNAGLTLGSRTISAVYSGSSDYLAVTSPGFAQTVNKAATALSITTSPASSTYGAAVTLTATLGVVAPGAGTPTGTVSFTAGGAALPDCPAATVTGGTTASCTTHFIPVGSPTALAAAYSGDTHFSPSAPAAGSIAVEPGTSLVASAVSTPTSSTFYDPVIFSVSVTGGGVTPTGTFVVSNDGVEVCRGTLAAGEGSCTSRLLPVGTHALVVTYEGDVNYRSSTGTITQEVNKAPSATSLVSSGSPSIYGATVIFTATLSGPGGTPSGTVTFKDGESEICGGPVTLTSGVATCTPLASTFGVATHAIRADYSGDGSYLASTNALSQVVNQATPTAAVFSSSNPSVWGEPVTFTATLSGYAGGAIPTGTVTFRDGSTTIGSGTLDASGQYSIVLPDRTPGSHAIVIEYAGSTDYLAATSATLAQAVNAAPTHVALAASPSPTVLGESVTLSIAVTADAPSTYIPSVSVQLLDGATVLGTVTLDGTGHATMTRSNLTVGAHPLTARFLGGSKFAESTSSVVTQQVARPATATSLVSLLPLSTFGDLVTFRITVGTVSPGVGVADGLVSIKSNGVELGTVTLAGGTGTFATSSFNAGSHELVADYLGSSDFVASSSAPLIQVVDKAQPRVQLLVSPSPSIFGQAVTLTATVSSEVAIPAGQIVFEDEGGGPLATLTMGVGGVTSFTTSSFAAGPHALRARYLGAADYKAASSAPFSLTVQKAQTSIVVTASPTPTLFGQPVTFTARLSVTTPGAGTPTGTVTFLDGSVVLGTGTVAADGSATLTIASMSAGNHTFTASYSGDGSFAASTSMPGTHQVNQATVLVTLVSGVSSSAYGQQVPLQVTVTAVAPAVGTPTGTVTLLEGATTLASLTLVDGRAATSVSSLAVGSHTLTASYGGDTAFVAGSGELVQAVAKAASATLLSAAPSPSTFGQSVLLTATVTVPTPGAGSPSGTVTFKDGTATLGTGTISGGKATLTSDVLTAGSHALIASYAGDASFESSIGSFTQPVSRSGTTLTLTASPSPSMYGQTVSLSLLGQAAAPGRGIPTGEITLLSDGVVVGHATFNGAGAATFSLSTLLAGTHQLSASFPGDANFLAASATSSLVVEQGRTSVELASSRNPSRRGRNVVFTATLSSPHAMPTGSVTFKADDTVLGRAELVDGVATYTDRTLTRHATPWVITAEYDGTDQFATATGTLDGGQLVENSPPVAGAGFALALGPSAASQATVQLDGLLDTGDVTLEAWVKPAWSDPAEVSESPTVLSLGDPTSTLLALGISPDRTHVTASAGGVARSVIARVDDQAWHHLALVASANEVKLYVDGLLADTFTATRSTSGLTLTLGQGLAGQVDDVRAWKLARTAEQLVADAMRPISSTTEGLAGYWRLDEGTGLELFDASTGAHDGTITPTAAPELLASSAFAPSQAWRQREVKQERDLLPAADAGYDVDGDDLALTISQAAANGLASADESALQVHYRAGDSFLGTDRFTFWLDDGQATSDYELELEVTRNLTCTATADCGGGDVCLQAVCVAPSSVNARAGGYGCSSGGGAPTGLWALLALALVAHRSRRRPVSSGAARAGVGLALLVAASSASAQTPAAFYLQTFEPTPAGDLLLVSPEAPVADRGPAAALVLSWATDPLVLRTNGAAIPGGKIVHRQFWGWVTASLPLFDRVLLDVAAPVALHQTGSQPFPDLAPVTSTAFGDLRIGARIPFYKGGWGSLAGSVDAWIATGSVAAFASDAAFRIEPKLIASGEAGAIAWSGSVGYHFRPELDVGYATITSGVTYTAGGAYRIGEFRVGPELYGRFASGSGASPVEGLLGGGWGRGDWDTSLAIGTAFDNAAGAAPYRLLGRVSWQPGKGAASRAAALAAAERKRAADQAAEEAAFKNAAAAVEAAHRAELARAEAERAAAAKREADRLAAEVAAAKAAAEASNLAKLQKGKIEINRPIQFEIAKDVILESSAPALQAVAEILKTHPEITKLRIDGHTDASGAVGFNLFLSEERARSVRKWLIERGGIDAGRLEAKGHGQTRPVADNATKEGRAINRRVDFLVLP